MKLFTLIAPLPLFAVFVLAQTALDAPITQNNPEYATYQAVLQESNPVQGQITGVSNDNGTGVNFNVNFFGFPDASVGPFAYHIHEFAVPSDGNCTGTGGHLSPYGRNETPPCDTTRPETCQPGDLSGKHGAVADTAREKSFQVTYLELYVSSDPTSPTFFGNRSVVVHASNGTRLNCGNFTHQIATNATETVTAPSATKTGGAEGGLTTLSGALVFAAAALAVVMVSL
ncbi:Cell surface superoxide dismutase [Cu-Zn] 4 [Elasticomyces elasticus]|uniref:Cell surface superoxide dismutase [Cu-Zn] 4 n=1 Tax=Exophiala sideris TaxID=1016849 RepID=A0ABR0J5L6_9EURO|nr:Cell surface superoxide dismutase [Cu-Zn] 4 [Elasticomyces elasticus]KAK5028297.1 Cell surface superoxide dismutase [Cu-Zn] 4 [Exophiala sideris]KAK5036058.1 Cell surface superoxide dismutase [Cu-Zn] 4 [Exophiala sideris]KAK5057095.1 Cell surface superoxide dismutase [Cu-Zn] 4 [Exophiala sideris]KAK5181502.1 Cell surface superoxide dismutase [Cu-Zn] 4 [Eurotiomycetes sp. CCFEE 6388]